MAQFKGLLKTKMEARKVWKGEHCGSGPLPEEEARTPWHLAFSWDALLRDVESRAALRFLLINSHLCGLLPFPRVSGFGDSGVNMRD